MSGKKSAGPPTFAIAAALALMMTLSVIALAPGGAGADIVRDHRTPPIVRDHRAKECRVAYSRRPSVPGFPATIAFCALPANSSPPLGSFCTCSELIEGRYQTVPGKVVLTSSPDG